MNFEMKRQLRFIILLWFVWQTADNIAYDFGEAFGRSAPIEPWAGLRYVFNSYNLLTHYGVPVIVFTLVWFVTRERKHPSRTNSTA